MFTRLEWDSLTLEAAQEDSILLWKSVCSNKLLAKCEIILFLNKCDILKVKLKAGVKIVKYIRSYRDRENNVETAAKCAVLSPLSLGLSNDRRFLDFREKFHAIQKEYSPEKRDFFCYMTAVTVCRLSHQKTLDSDMASLLGHQGNSSTNSSR